MASQELKIKVSQVLQGGNALKETRKEVAELKAALFTLESQGKKNTAQYKQFEVSLVSANGKLKAHNTEMKNLTGATNVGGAGMMKFAGQIGAVVAGVTVAIAAIVKLGTEILNLAKSGAEFNVLKKGFEELSGGVENSKESLALFDKSLAGNLTDRKIMALANSFRLLGESDTEIAQFFDIAESKTELFEGNVETAIEQIQRFIETGSSKGALTLKWDISAINKEMKLLGNTTDEGIKKMSAEEQQILRKQAVYKLYGRSLDEIKQKKKDEADAIQSLFTLYENLKTQIMSLMSTALKPFIGFINQVIDYIKSLNLSFDDLLTKFPELEKTIQFTGEVFKRFGEDAFNSIKVFINANLKLIEAVGTATGIVVRTVIGGVLIVAKAIREIVALTNKIGSVIGITLDGSGIDTIISKLESLSQSSAKNGTKDLSTLAEKKMGFTTKNDSNSKTNKDIDKETESQNKFNAELENTAIKYKEIALIAGLPIGKAHGKNRGPVDLKPLNPRQKDIEQNEEIERLLNSAMNNFDGMVNATATMLQNLGLMETGFGQILNGVIQVINIFKSAFDVGSSIFGFIGDIISLLPGGGIAGGILKTVGGSSGGGFASGGQIFGAGSGTSDSILARLSNGEFIVNAESTKRNLALLKAINGNQQSTGYAYAAGGMVKAQSMSPNITVVVNSEVESTKAIKFYQNTFDKYQSRLNKKRL